MEAMTTMAYFIALVAQVDLDAIPDFLIVFHNEYVVFFLHIGYSPNLVYVL